MSNENQKTTKLTLFLDAIGRTVLGEEVPSDKPNIMSVKNPVLLLTNADQQGRMSVQLLPILFREFLADPSEDVIFHFELDKVTLTSAKELDYRLHAQWNQLFNKGNAFVTGNQTADGKSERVVNLFEE